MKRLAVVCVSVTAALILASVPRVSAASLYPPGGFRLPASNGYSLHAIAFDGDPHELSDALILLFGRKGSSAFYAVQKRAEVTETSIKGDLGRLGSIDLHFVPSGQPRRERATCNRRPIAFDSGFYEGRVEFEGEEGFTKVDATRTWGNSFRGESDLLRGHQ